MDVKAKIYNNKRVGAKCAQDEEYKLYNNSREKSMFAYIPHLDKIMPPFVFADKNVKYQNLIDYSIYEITPKKGTHTSLRVKQKGTQTDIFNGQIALVFSRPADIKIEITVRSNEFPDCPKTFPYFFGR